MLANKSELEPEASSSGRMFHDEWTCKFGVIEHKGKALYCICSKVITVRFYNINRHLGEQP